LLTVRVSFGPFALDSGRRRLSRGADELHLSPKAFDLLCLLLERRPNVVDKNALMAAIWPDTVVVEANLNVLISEIRKALDDTPHRKQYIETVNRVGFSFCGDVEETEARRPAPVRRSSDDSPRFWLAWNGGTRALTAGDNVIGRHPDCSVFVDGDGVSRRHAVIRIDAGRRQATLEDLASTNGTLHQRTPVTSRVNLSNGDVIKVGSVELTFRAWADDTERPTERITRFK
jgi:DNA-binding winged helix-turn-helix (wHTH) protein